MAARARPRLAGTTLILLALLAVAAAAGCSGGGDGGGDDRGTSTTDQTTRAGSGRGAGDASWVYLLSGYRGGRLDEVAEAGRDWAVVDLARDGSTGWFTAEEVREVQDAGTAVLAYFSVATSETYRPEHAAVEAAEPGLVVSRWEDWPDEWFVRFWEERWWDLVVRPRVDQALDAGFDGAYLDGLVAYEELPLEEVPGETRETLARRMADLVVRIAGYAAERRPGFLVFPQNAPELRTQAGYVDAIDGLGIEELRYLATDEPCTADWCAETLAHVQALHDAGKVVLAVDYATEPDHVADACRRNRADGFVPYVTTVELDRISPACPGS